MSLDQVATEAAARLGLTARPFATVDFGREQKITARSVLIQGVDLDEQLQRVRLAIPDGYVAFLGTGKFAADPNRQKVEIVIAPAADQFDILRIAQTDACNYGLRTEDLVARLKDYDAKMGIDIISAVTDTIEFDRLSDPADLASFCDDLYDFCPDIVNQGTGSVDALETEIRASKRVFLWWD